MRLFGRYAIRAVTVAAVVAVGLVFPQHLAWGAPETRTKEFLSVAIGQTITVPFPATHVVVGWEGPASAELAVRGQQADGSWGPWKPALSDDLATEGEQEGMAIVEDATKLEVGVLSGTASNIRLLVIDTENGPRHLELQSATEPAAAMSGLTQQPPIITRSQWGADEGLRRGAPEFANISRITMHHTVTDNNDPNPAATVRAIYTWHTNGNGWNDIGYNFLIDQQGRIYEGRYARTYAAGEAPTGENASAQGVIGAHSLNNNTGNVGIALLGTLNSVRPTNAQIDSIEKLMAWEGDRHNLDLLSPSVVIGHRDVYQTECPGNAAYNLLPEIRDRAATIKFLATQPGNTPGYWVAGKDGAVTAFGSATNYGSMAGRSLNGQIVSMTRTANGQGYWLMGSDGGIFSFGNAGFHGSMGGKKLNKPIVGLAPTPSGNGYWLVASDGGIFAFGDAGFHGSMGGKPLNKPVVGMAATKTGGGYWLVASDGGIFAYGDATFYGSTGNIKLAQPVVTMSRTPNGDGYWLVASDGGVFAYGTAGFKGSIPMLRLSSFSGIVQATSTATGAGYYMLANDGGVYSFGDARFWGAPGGNRPVAGMALVPE